MPKLLADSTVGAFPSYLEGFGIGPVEQMAAGLPVVAYDIPGPRDTVGTLGGDFLAKPGDKVDFAAKISRILAMTESDYSELAKRCSATARLFTNEKIAMQTLNVYKQSLS